MTRNEYIVRNCPTCIISPSCCAKYHIDNGHAKDCQDIEDCVIKQVIEKCKYIIDDDIGLNCNKFERGLDCFECDYDGHREVIMRNISRISLAKQILQLFDIEEVRE